MNLLLLEQHPRTISSKLQDQSSNDVNNPFSATSLVVKIKREKHDRHTLALSSMAHENNHQPQRLKRSNPISSTRRPSSPAFNGKQQSNKRSVIIDNNNNDLTSNLDENSSIKRFKQDHFNNKVDACVETVSIGLATEPDQLGPCEPGTSVVLEGIVWNETDSGVLVVNVTWRGKTYVGTLLDSTKQDWACPRLTCESPTSDYDARNSSKTSRAKRAYAGGNNRNSSQHISINPTSSGADDRKLRSSIKSRQSKRTNLPSIEELPASNQSSSSPLVSPFPNNTTFFPSSNSESQLISCPELQCHKQFVSETALQYHVSNAHKKTDSTTTVPIPQVNPRDEEDVAHILANVADYVRRSSPRSSPDHQRSTTLTWPCPQRSSNLVLSSALNNNEQTLINSSRINAERDDNKSSIKSADHFLLHVQDQPTMSSSWSNIKSHDQKKSLKIPTPPPSSFVPISITPTVQHPAAPSSPAYSDISDEDPTTTPTRTITTNEHEPLPPSTINLLNDQSIIPNAVWPTQMLLQQYGSYMQQMTKELTSNCLNSKSNPNGTSDSTVKNILDSRGSSIAKSPSPSINSGTIDYPKSVYSHSISGLATESKYSPTKINSLTSPNENLLKPTNNTSR